MRSLGGWTLGLGLALMLGVGCGQSRRPQTAGGAPISAAQRKANESIVRSVARAHCDREERCDQIGPDAKYGTRAACLQRIRRDWHELLSSDECRAGVSKPALEQCLAELHAERCGDPFDTLARRRTCSDVCALENDG